MGAECPLDSQKFANNQEKEGGIRKNWGEEEKTERKLGRFFHFAPLDRLGWLRYCSLCILLLIRCDVGYFQIIMFHKLCKNRT